GSFVNLPTNTTRFNIRTTPYLLVIFTNGHMSNDVVSELRLAIKFIYSSFITAKVDDDIIAITIVFDFICQTAFTHFINFPNLRPVVCQNIVETLNQVGSRFNIILTDNGAEIEKVDEMGKRRLAYKIKNYRDGYYVVVNFSGDERAVNEFDRQAKFTDDIIRHMAIREDDQ